MSGGAGLGLCISGKGLKNCILVVKNTVTERRCLGSTREKDNKPGEGCKSMYRPQRTILQKSS